MITKGNITHVPSPLTNPGRSHVWDRAASGTSQLSGRGGLKSQTSGVSNLTANLNVLRHSRSPHSSSLNSVSELSEVDERTPKDQIDEGEHTTKQLQKQIQLEQVDGSSFASRRKTLVPREGRIDSLKQSGHSDRNKRRPTEATHGAGGLTNLVFANSQRNNRAFMKPRDDDEDEIPIGGY